MSQPEKRLEEIEYEIAVGTFEPTETEIENTFNILQKSPVVKVSGEEERIGLSLGEITPEMKRKRAEKNIEKEMDSR